MKMEPADVFESGKLMFDVDCRRGHANIPSGASKRTRSAGDWRTVLKIAGKEAQ